MHRRLTPLLTPTLLLAAAVVAQAQAPDPLAAAAAEPGAVVTESGLVFRTLKAGSGATPKAIDSVRVHYRGTFTDGREFDSSYKRGEPATFPLNKVIKCWTEGVARMKVGETARLTCPASIAYGDRGSRDVIPPGATLRFDVELLGVISP
jgi:FKBP-type peptidyl-prolyl cis-trans isomerase FkpA